MWNLSSEAADTLFAASNISLLVGTVIVVLATGGTIWASSKREMYAEIRQSQNELNIAKASEASAIADARAAEANMKAAGANERAAKLENQTAELKRQAEEAKAETAKVKERIHKIQSARRLEKSQAEALSTLLRSDVFQTKPQPRLRVAAVPGGESKMYAIEFLDLFQACNVNCYPTSADLSVYEIPQLMPCPVGLALTVKTLECVPPHVVQFHLKLLEIGLDHVMQVDPGLRSDEGFFTVMTKPEV